MVEDNNLYIVYFILSFLLLHFFDAMSKVYEADPDADTLIILTGYDRPFAAEDGGDAAPASNGNNSKAWLVNGSATAASKDGSPEFRIKVSSKHMSLASPFFQNKFGRQSSSSNSGAVVQSDGRVHVRLRGFDPTAVTTVVNIIHSRGLRAPKALDLETLAKVAVVVDALQCYEAVEAYADRWIARLAPSAASSAAAAARSDRDLVLWVFVTYVFQQPDLFRAATRQAISRSTGTLKTFGLPLRKDVIGKTFISPCIWK